MSMKEAQTRSALIDPVLDQKGWSSSPNCQEYWVPEVPVYPGRIDSEGNHRDPGAADYVLYCELEPMAVIEAKAEGYAYDKGETQAKYYAEALGVRFAYSTNGHDVIEYDMANGGKSRVFPMSQFPTPYELAQQYGKDERSELEKVCQWTPFAHPGGKFTRYYQERAVEAVIAKLGRGEKRALLTLATGTGKTFIAYQLCRKLVLARWSNTKPLGNREPTILFITDRNILADQALGDFYFQDHACFRYLAGTEKVPMDRLVYFTLFQTLLGEDGNDTKYKKFKPDFFDLVIIDECHRGGRNDESQWRKILDYFSGACHVGLTATPQCDVNGNTYEYFGKPAYEYSLRRGIADGFLTQYRVDKLKSTLSAYKVEDGDIINCPEEIDPTKWYGNDEIERKHMLIYERDKHFVEALLERMPLDQKAIVFCVTQSHARRIARIIREVAATKGQADPHYCEVVTADAGKIGEGYLKQFQNNENTIPTILTTSEKLSTGVNAVNIRSIALFRNVNSMVEFKQIVGRGTRVCEGKGYFKIYDFTDATDKFKDPAWDGEVVCPKCGQNPCVCHKPEHKPCPVCGNYPCTCPPKPCPKCGHLPCICPPPVKPTIKIQLGPNRVVEAHWEEYVFVDDQRISVSEFIQNFVEAVTKVASDEQELREKWSTPDSRQELLESLKEYGYSPDRLKDVQKMLEREDCDILDIMLNLVYSEEALTRAWRVKHMESELAKLNPARRAFAEVVLQKYVTSGVWVLTRATLHDYLKIKFGSIAEATSELGYTNPADVIGLYDDLQRKLYDLSAEKVAV